MGGLKWVEVGERRRRRGGSWRGDEVGDSGHSFGED